jgi:hypothetical protein
MFGLRNRKVEEIPELGNGHQISQQRGATIWFGQRVNDPSFDATLVAPYSNAKYLIAIDLIDSTKPVTREQALEFARRAESASVNLAMMSAASGIAPASKSLTAHDAPELVPTMVRNHCPRCAGIGAHDGPEYAAVSILREERD